ncbi:MAG: hypothetical protein H6707_14525 [Deltaproteobacteria bacterium]|nr:hypothetical protein [Deltaproteobacteria bacterium]
MIVFESLAKPLLLLHALASLALTGAVTHNGLIAIRQLFGQATKTRLQKLYVKLAFYLYVPSFVLGLLIYPAFRVRVRAAYLDAAIPLAKRLFEVKEHWLAIGLAILLVYYPLSRVIDVRRRDGVTLMYNVFGIALALIVWLSTIVGLLLVMQRSI